MELEAGCKRVFSLVEKLWMPMDARLHGNRTFAEDGTQRCLPFISCALQMLDQFESRFEMVCFSRSPEDRPEARTSVRPDVATCLISSTYIIYIIYIHC